MTAVIKPHTVEAVVDALRDIDISGLTVSEVRGFGRQGGHTETYRGTEYQVDFVPKLRLEVLVPVELTDQVVDCIAEAAHTGRIGDGKVWVTDVSSVVRIRTKEMGPDAI